MRIAIDAMGGDRAPAEIVKGAVLASRQIPDCEPVLVGDKARIEAELASIGDVPKGVTVVHASQVIDMNDHAVDVRKKPDSSIARAVGLVKAGEAVAVISAGHTGAAVAASMLNFGRLQGVQRPGIGVPMPTVKGSFTLIDVGANIVAKPLHLLQYGLMASIYAQKIRGVERPRIGLLNIGAEDEKGNALLKEAHSLLSGSGLNFHGNVEGSEIFQGVCDVVVCEGLAGNLVLKSCEGLAEALLTIVRSEAKSRLTALGARDPAAAGALGATFKEILGGIQSRTDYAEFGGAPLLGVDGICIISHGRSDARAIQNAIRVAGEFAARHINEEIVREVAALQQPA